MLTSRALTLADDELHQPREGDPSWAETSWFAAQIPERNLCIWVYTLFRTNLGVLSSSIYVFGGGDGELWRQPYYRLFWHQQLPKDFTLTRYELPFGLSGGVRKPLEQFEVHYDDGAGFSVDLNFDAIHPAHAVGVTDEIGHIDQFGRVTGQLTMGGETIPIDCIEMRDRTWSPRREQRDRAWLGYSYGAVDEKTAFQSSVRRMPDGSMNTLAGFVLVDGVVHDLSGATRRVTRDADGRPVSVHLTLTGGPNGTVEIEGTVEGLLAMHTSPYFVFVSRMRWVLPNGSIAWGEDQDTWAPGMFRELILNEAGSTS